MASQTRSYEKKKLLGQIYTPLHLVEKILRLSGFYDTDFSNKKILDPACGDGRFLVPVVEFLIKNVPSGQLPGILQNVHGWDIDPLAIAKCRANLDQLVAPLGLTVKWKLRKCDALFQRNNATKYDLIVGNPPYIRIQHLPEKQRLFIRQEYTFCRSGSTDAYVAFFELASVLLTKNGVCGFITPNSFFISETGKLLRSYFEQNQNLRHITNYGKIPVFENASTYSAVTVFGNKKEPHFTFEQCIDKQFNCQSRDFYFTELSSPWKLSVPESQMIEGRKLGDICRISVGITTLADKYYLFHILEETDGTSFAKNKNGDLVYLETELLKPVIKGSKLKSSTDPVTEYILFPYQKNEAGKHQIIPENELECRYPKTYSYFLKVKPALDRRDNGKANPVAWYAFGRSQGLDSSFGKKIIFSPMNREPNFVLYENPEVTVYSGYFIKYDGDTSALLEQLNSARMADFISVAGRDFQGGYKGYNKKVIENYIITSMPEATPQLITDKPLS
ncbi:class I SAM-dependent DNA methyltransferase [Dyadobacter sp. CY343]|uniref:HsdM family class I SAM-dependent methyltransferase n=1 Tax=Dyadobacter sp. CY343 TaxID=2907299 RepID=UPI001F33CBAA|nr:N-6 DNA methylase [Dyadobacter sp. CY343]MCE7060487.1 Eco57I restriction-modification methylase domain-containing protein [Dyadobacter sp. CY343]